MLSVVILIKNEEKNIVDCLESILWADEIIIVDDFSKDRTVEIIESFKNKKIRIYKNNLNNDFSAQRNFGLSKTTKKWILFLDADERVAEELKEEINTIIINSSENVKDGYFVKRKDVIWGKMLNHGESGNIKLLRFGKKHSGVWVGKVHEEWQVNGKTEELGSFLLHYPHQTLNEFLTEINFYSSLRANELYEKKITVSYLDLLKYPVAKFLLNYFLKLGFLDKMEGLIFALMMSFHSFLVRGKLWLLWQKKNSSVYS
ncbi:MAG: glycosyltransferase family 2 protein [Candidatus Levybacteria bacterium CG10_big_fil_rev_8_21_14_0_10_35_13]|nr:MAG: glycosyltransferase family 2 protein [Candidatus Levybacteria bacterium CG10_big_fil_rev_8_21_14_0_10_35_13]